MADAGKFERACLWVGPAFHRRMFHVWVLASWFNPKNWSRNG